GLAIAGVNERRRGAQVAVTATGIKRPPPLHRPPLVIDLSALWAGPLAAHLLWLADAEVVKVESRNRPDAMRGGDPQLFARINQGKASVQLDLRAGEDREALIALIRRADIVIEAARPRALRQLGIDADSLVRETPGLIWMTITGHGIAEDAANWVGFGDDCGVAGRLSAAMLGATGQPAFVGDAIADPMTGISAARYGWECWRGNIAGRLTISMRDIVGEALRDEQARDADGFDEALRHWGQAAGQPFALVPHREAGPVRPLGADNAAWLGGARPC
ncbi:MAG: CoA transferase, partial [Sphingomonadales bacterium]